MANTYLVKRSSVAGKVPLAGDLQVGELAVNLADQKIYSKNASGTVIQLGGGAGSGDVVGPSSSTNNAVALFDGTTGKLLKNGSVPGTIYTQNADNVNITGGSINGPSVLSSNLTSAAYSANGVSISCLRGYGGMTTVNNASYSFVTDNSVKIFAISFGSGSGCVCIADYISSTITILGPNSNGTCVNSASPASNQFGIHKSAFSHTIQIKIGSAAATTYGGWSISMLCGTAS